MTSLTGVDLIPLGQQLVHVALADHRPQRGLGDLRHRVVVVLHVDDRLERVDHPVVDDGVHPHGHVVPGDALLGGHGHGDDLHVDLGHPVADRPDSVQPGAAQLGQDLPEPVDDALLVLLYHLERARGRDYPEQHQDDDDGEYCTHRDHLSS